ncbi:zf-TFIIB domain-containing protein [Syntrophus aciditrophicus]|uniref:Hypothetical cytosolic protein n=1 Tax=Syntrophus aciditrophicus (strain SB) TaxID=56780 RepID=Q2LTG4_SYNAS|nr:zf-TFIIB domain-containing protein [Syntrophus aciditrophicus]ABC77377.1 hypothetical cytosolic protein [Syntrophus aciditrophicus SB]
MNCPICNIPLAITERQGIEIDYCPKCRGELDKIIDRSAAEIPSRSYSERHHDHHDHYNSYNDKHHSGHHDHYKKRKSFLHELFD